jgi:hypothetical protein
MTAFAATLGVIFHQEFDPSSERENDWLTNVVDFTLQLFVEANGAALENVQDEKFLRGVAQRARVARQDVRGGRSITVRGFKKAPSHLVATPDWGREDGYVKTINRDHHVKR